MNNQFILLDTNTLLNFLNGEELEVNWLMIKNSDFGNHRNGNSMSI